LFWGFYHPENLNYKQNDVDNFYTYLLKVFNKVGENGVMWGKVGKYFYIRLCIARIL
jgi:hypothetical protein